MVVLIKRLLQALSLMLAAPLAVLAGGGRFRAGFTFGAHFCALAPGIPGDYLRSAFYRLTLRSASLDTRISFGTFFAHPEATLARDAYIGAYCVFGRVRIGERTQVASQVQILSGKHQHGRTADGRVTGAEKGSFQEIQIGDDCWIGAGAIVMADVGAGSTIGAGSVVVKDIPPGSVAVGNPARPLPPANAI